MKANTEPPPDGKHSVSIMGYVLWPVVALVIYVLSTGPLMMLAGTSYFDDHPAFGDWIEKVYSPVEWTYESTMLHKPLGMYFHLWDDRFDANGDEK